MIDSIEWDFSKVPDDQLLRCCKWEFLREIPPDRTLVDLDEDIPTLNPLPPWSVAIATVLTAQELVQMNCCCRIVAPFPYRHFKKVLVQSDSGIVPVRIGRGGRAVVTLLLDFQSGNSKDMNSQLSMLTKGLRSQLKKHSEEFLAERGPGTKKYGDIRARLCGLALMRLRHSMPVEQVVELLAGHPYMRWLRDDPVYVARTKIDEIRKKVLLWYRDYNQLSDRRYPLSWEPYLLNSQESAD